MNNEKIPEQDGKSSTEEKIKDAARRVFTRKGYAETRTRDIADESGYNLALINYYFRSKENLFEIIMTENIQTFIHSVMDIVNDRNTTLQQKIEILISHYIDMLIGNPNLPLFMLNAINADPRRLVKNLGFDVDHENLYIVQQWKEVAAGMQLKINPLHIVINVLSMTIFPFAASPMLRNRLSMTIEEFNELMQERKKLIPVWVRAIILGSAQPGANT